jgi:carbon-monoxide dehydrogenase large subunit
MDTGIGQALPRREDQRLLTGKGSYSDDYVRADQLYGFMLRSPHAHARVTRVETASAKRAPGVRAVLTGADYLADGLKPIPSRAMQVAPEDITKAALAYPDGRTAFEHPIMPVVAGKVHHVGEGVAFVVADTLAQAKDASELIEVEYEVLPSVIRGLDAIAPGAPTVWDEAPGNIAFDGIVGDCAATEAALARASHVVEGEFVSNRVANCPMEPRACLAEIVDGRYVLWTGGQGVHGQKGGLAAVFSCPPDKVRVVQKDVGGGFGPRGHLHAEYVCAMWAAKKLGRPVKWNCERTEAFVADYQARDVVTRASLAFDANGLILGMKVTLYSNLGGNTINYVPAVNGSRIATTLYRVPNLCLRAIGILTNTLPSVNYRGAGRPQAMLAMERLLDMAAERIGIDRIELRRRNLIAQGDFPYKTQGGLTYDCGEFEKNMDDTMRLADWNGFPARRAAAAQRGRLRGIGLANYIETPVGIPIERAHVTVRPDEAIDVVIGTLSQGQGHETSFAQVISSWLGVKWDRVNIITGDSDIVPEGGGTHSDRSIRLGGFVMVKSCDQIIDKGKKIAAQMLEAAESDIEFREGRFTVAGTDRSLGLFEAARAAADGKVPEPLRGALDGGHKFVGRIPAYPNGCAVCEVEIDPDTGTLEIVTYACIDDVGRVVNPLIVDGQVHGGIAQGVGQALMEHVVYGADDGQVLAGSFMDYTMPRADTLPSFKVETNEVITQGNPLGVKGGGEAGTTGALAAVMNAVHDALKQAGVPRLDMPATPHRIWQAIREAKKNPLPP